jgi:hypothetical protein
MPATTRTPARTLVDARTTPVTITTLPPRPGPVPATAPLRVPAVRADRRPARAAAPVPSPARPTCPAVRVSVAVAAVLAAVAVAGLLAGQARAGLAPLAALGRAVLAVAVLAWLGCLLASTARVHCPGCRGARR